MVVWDFWSSASASSPSSYLIKSSAHSSLGQTADRVLIRVDTDLGAKDLLNSRLAYVSALRAAFAVEEP